MADTPVPGFNATEGALEYSVDLAAWVSLGGEGVSLAITGGEDDVAEQHTINGQHPIVANSRKHTMYTLEIVMAWTAPGGDYETLRGIRDSGTGVIAVRWAIPDFLTAGLAMYTTADRAGAPNYAGISRLDFPTIDVVSAVKLVTMTLNCPHIVEDVTPTPP